MPNVVQQQQTATRATVRVNRTVPNLHYTQPSVKTDEGIVSAD